MKYNILHNPKTLFNSKAIFEILILTMSAFPLLPYGYRSVCTIFILLLAIYTSFTDNFKTYSPELKKLIILLLPYFFLITSLFYSNEFNTGFNKLVQMLSLLVFPIVVFLLRKYLNKVLIKRIFFVFSISVVLLILYELWLYIINYDYLVADLTNKELKLNNIKNAPNTLDTNIVNKIKTRRLRNFLSNEVNIHPTYLGMWVIFVIFGLLSSYLRKKQKLIIRIFILIIIMSLTIWLFIIASRISLIVFILIAILMIFFHFKNKFSLKKTSLIFGFTIIIFSTCYNLIPSYSARINEVFNFELKLPTKGKDIFNYNSTNVRYGIYHCSAKIIRENFIFGVGIGDAQSKLNNCYSNDIESKIYTWVDYNSHNQYLFFGLAAGIMGLLSYFFSLIYQIRKAFENASFQHFCFLIIITCFSLTENILTRSDGVIFYSLFGALYIFNSKKK